MQNRKRNRDLQNRILDSVGEGEGKMSRENSINTCICITESLCCTPETNTVNQLYSNIKLKV